MRSSTARRSLERLEDRCCPAVLEFLPHSIWASEVRQEVVEVIDYDFDSDLDLVVQSESQVTLLENVAGFTEFTPHRLLDMPNFSAQSVVDMDQDGDLDIYGAFANGRTVWLEQGDDGMYTAPAKSALKADHFLDLDADGDLDTIALLERRGGIAGRFVWNETIGTEVGFGIQHPLPIEIPWPDLHSFENVGMPLVVPLDIDGDGDQDLISAASQYELSWHENLAPGQFSAGHLIARRINYDEFIAADFDGDGDIEIVLDTPSDYDVEQTIYLYEFADGEFRQRTTRSLIPAGGFAYDVNRDGLADILRADRWLQQIPSSGAIKFEEHRLLDAPDSSRPLLMKDLDGDGDSDLLFSTEQGIRWHELIHGEGRSADLDGDGNIDYLDFLTLARNFGENTATHEDGDLNRDYQVSFVDFLIFARQYPG